MKLYFYELVTRSYKKDYKTIYCTECEAEEKPKTYVPIKGKCFPDYSRRLLKDDIGCFIGLNSNIVVFTEPSFERAKEKFRVREIGRIKTAKENISKMEELLRAIEESEDGND